MLVGLKPVDHTKDGACKFRHFLIELLRQEVDVFLVGLKPVDHTKDGACKFRHFLIELLRQKEKIVPSTSSTHQPARSTQHRESNPHSEVGLSRVDMTSSMSCSACGSYLRPNLAAGNLRLWKTRRHSKSTIVPRICVPRWAAAWIGAQITHSLAECTFLGSAPTWLTFFGASSIFYLGVSGHCVGCLSLQ